ncbi:MAG TPA: MFS transporter [Candidatus Binatia bacterium]|nr:MFS transporter [Candidatus Binatia bacterium]
MKLQNERWVLLLLAAIQFAINLDFLIILPLGPQYMRVLHITPAQFNLIVAAYAIAAGVSGIAAGFLLDRFDRKTALLWLFLGFATGTLLCALAPTYHLLLAARALAGTFGGVTGALILAIVGDVIPEHRRGAATGLVMSAFSVASILGVPLGLVLASYFNWHVPFYVIAGISVPILMAVFRSVPALRSHLEHAGDQHPAARMLAVLMEPNHQMAFVFMMVLTCAGFTIFPTLATFMVYNVGLTEKQLPFIYLTGGLCTLFSMNWIGRWADRAGKLRVFTLMSLAASIPITSLTNLPRVPLPVALTVSTLLMICMSGRFVPAMAMMTATVESRYRGGFMSVNSSVQQFSCGLAAWLSGRIIGQGPNQEITHYPAAGLVSLACVLVCIWLARFLRPAPGELSNAPVFAEPA